MNENTSDGARPGPVLVTGGTGNQGGPVVRHLLDRGWRVRVLVRDPQKPAAQALAERGAELVEGNLDAPSSLKSAAEDAYGVFSVQNYWEHGAEAEIRQGMALADTAQAAGVSHFVFSSVGGAERSSGVEHFESKWRIERHLDSLDLPTTVLRPVFLMENLKAPHYRAAIANGVLPLALSPTKPLQMIACEDIGALAAIAFDRPSEFAGVAMEIAGDEVTPAQAAEALTGALGWEVNHVQPPIERLREMNPDVASMFEWFEADGYAADLAAVREIHPSPMSLREWIGTVEWTAPPQP